MVKAQLIKRGNSLAIRIPKPVVQRAELREGDWLEVEAVAEGHVRLCRENDIPTLAELVAQITPENRYPEI
jgi:antitoxin MazE